MSMKGKHSLQVTSRIKFRPFWLRWCSVRLKSRPNIMCCLDIWWNQEGLEWPTDKFPSSLCPHEQSPHPNNPSYQGDYAEAPGPPCVTSLVSRWPAELTHAQFHPPMGNQESSHPLDITKPVSSLPGCSLSCKCNPRRGPVACRNLLLVSIRDCWFYQSHPSPHGPTILLTLGGNPSLTNGRDRRC